MTEPVVEPVATWPPPAPPVHVERALVVVAHPDDVDFGAAGTVAMWVAEGVEVTYCLVTDGDAGGFDDTPRSEMAGLRRAEQTAAAAVVGVTDLRFLGHPDGLLYPTLALRRDISRVIRQVRPQRVLTQSPDLYLDRLPASHPDHRATGSATIDAVYPDARNPFAHPELLRDEGLEAWTVRELWVMGGVEASHVVDITDVYDQKMVALRSHVSQVAHNENLDAMMRGWGTMVAQGGGLPEGRLGELFRVVPIPF